MRSTLLALALTCAALTPTTHAQLLANTPGVSIEDPQSHDDALAPEERAVMGPALADEAAAPAESDADEADTRVSDTESLPLPAIEQRALGSAPDTETTASQGVGGWVRTVLALGAVLGLLLVLRAIVVRASRRSGLVGELGAGGRAPSGVLSVLGRYPVARGRSLVLLQLDTRVLLLEQSSDGFKTLSEVTEPDEVASILTKTRDEEGASQAARFNAMLRDLEDDPRTLHDDDDFTADQLTERVRRIRGMTA